MTFVGAGWPVLADPDGAGPLDTRDRFQIELSSPSDENALTLDSTRYLRFYVWVSSCSRTRLPSDPSHHQYIVEAWQAHTGAAMRAPFQIELLANDTPENKVTLSFQYSNDSVSARQLYAIEIDTDRWHNFAIELTPRTTRAGGIRVWVNPGITFNFDYPDSTPAPLPNASLSVAWGYDLLRNAGMTGRFAVRVGLHRHQPAALGEMPFVFYRMDSVKLTRTPQAMPGE
ncbi:hypothetical protein [Sandaracinus amylolyticus]|uniref:hypothetical protein n=1 Tax=Sandaracinus amylolyticus TaxID=927083 RepID=UPI001F21A499|nr:hypothetical protein [Sandaracinus amylolyticus]